MNKIDVSKKLIMDTDEIDSTSDTFAVWTCIFIILASPKSHLKHYMLIIATCYTIKHFA